MRYDLEERTAKFGENIIQLCKKVPQGVINTPIISQLIRAGTSIGANYYEATGASSKKDFRNKCFICKKEAIETKYRLRMLSKSDSSFSDECRKYWKEAQELTLIFSKISSSSK